MTKLTQLETTINQCEACRLHNSCYPKIIFQKQVPIKHHALLFVGEAPGVAEDAIGEPFVGPSGKLLHKILYKELNLKPRDFIVTNSVLCTPFTEGSRTTIGTPESKEWQACSVNLHRIILTLKPSMIFALGQIAHKSLEYIHQHHYTLLHPSAILRAGGEISVEYSRFVLQLRKILDDAKKA
jgi:DNA polymerase